MTKIQSLALMAPLTPNTTLKEMTMTKLASLAAALVLFAPLAVATLIQAAQIVA